jgi:hypothetical protein
VRLIARYYIMQVYVYYFCCDLFGSTFRRKQSPNPKFLHCGY